MCRITALVSALIFALTNVASAQSYCITRTEMLKLLGDKYTERPSAFGIAKNGGLVEVLTTENGSTWTIIITMPNGFSCMVAAGEAWENRRRVDLGLGT